MVRRQARRPDQQAISDDQAGQALETLLLAFAHSRALRTPGDFAQALLGPLIRAVLDGGETPESLTVAGALIGVREALAGIDQIVGAGRTAAAGEPDPVH